MSAVVVVAVTDAVIVDQPPVARADVVEVRAGGKVAVPVLANDYDPEGGTLIVTAVTPFEGADVAPGLNGQTVDVRVAPTVVSSFTLSYTVADKAGNQSSAFLDVRIVPTDEVNRPPIARTDIARTRSGVPVIVPAVANDSDPDGDIIAVESIRTQPSGGTAAVSEGAVVYTPSDTFVGTDRLTYSLVDAGGEFAVGEVLIGVMPAAGANRAPEAFDDDVQAVAGSAPLVYNVLANDSDADGDTLNVTTVGTPSSGAAAVADDGGAVVFTPPAQLADATALDVAFTYAIDDGRGGTASATVSVHVTAASQPLAPIAVDDMVGPLSAGQSVDVDVLRNDLDPDGDPTKLTVSSTDPALVVKQPGTFTVTAGTTSGRHVYTVTDPAGLTDTAEVDVLVVPNRAPAVTPFTAQTTADQPLELDLTAQATDPDGDTLYFACCDQPHGGAATTLANGAGQLARDVHPRRRVQRAGDVRLRRRRPAGPHRRRRGGHRRARPVEPAAGGHRHHAHRRRRHPDEHRSGRAGHRSRRRRPADVRDQRAGRGSRDAHPVRRQRAGIGADRRRRSHRLVHVHGHRLGRARAPAARCR